MRAYTLPAPDPLARAIRNAVNGSSKARERWTTFPNGEDRLRVERSDADACVIGATAPPGDGIFRTALLADAAKRSGAERVTVVIPYFGYGRQDRQTLPGEAVGASVAVRMIAAAGAARIVTADLHSTVTSEESPIRIDSVSSAAALSAALRDEVDREDLTVVAPDRGACGRADLVAAGLGLKDSAAWIEKFRHPATGKVTAAGIRGETAGETAVIVDDILDTGRTIELAYRTLRARGFRRFFLCVTHAVFSDGAAQRIRRLGFSRILVTDTVPLPAGARRLRGIRVVGMADTLLAALNPSRP